MRDLIIWLFTRLSEFITTSLTWKIYGDFSFTHFIFASIFLFAIFKLFGFGVENYGDGLEQGISFYKNVENKKDKKNYTHFLKSERSRIGDTIYTTTYKYKVNKKTGEVTKL